MHEDALDLQFELARRHAEGIGVERDIVKASELYRKDKNAREKRDGLEKDMDMEQIMAAQKRTKELKVELLASEDSPTQSQDKTEDDESDDLTI